MRDEPSTSAAAAAQALLREFPSGRRFNMLIGVGGRTLTKVGINPDGTLHNPRGYPEADVIAALNRAADKRKERRAQGLLKAGITRRRHVQAAIAATANNLFHHGVLPPSRSDRRDGTAVCRCCRTPLTDEASLDRGLGPECFSQVTAVLRLMQDRAEGKAIPVPRTGEMWRERQHPEHFVKVLEEVWPKNLGAHLAVVDTATRQVDEISQLIMSAAWERVDEGP